MEKKLNFIINPQAKNGYGINIWRKVEAELLRKSISYHKFFTDYPGHAIELARSIGEKHLDEKAVIIAIGGDGTFHEVVNGMVNYHTIEVGLIPAGSGNDFSRGFGLPTEPIIALNHIIRNIGKPPRMVDVGVMETNRAEKRYFVNNMGAGFDADVADEVNRSKWKERFNRFSLGKLVYVMILIKKLFSFQATRVEITVDGSAFTFENTWFVTVSNQPYFGGGMKISPSANPYDGKLNITVVQNLSKLKLLAVFISVFWGGHTRFREVKTFLGRTITIDSPVPRLVHCDGEITGVTPCTVKVMKEALSVRIGDVSEGDF